MPPFTNTYDCDCARDKLAAFWDWLMDLDGTDEHVNRRATLTAQYIRDLCGDKDGRGVAKVERQ